MYIADAIKKYELPAVYTVEAALILPICFAVLFLLVFLDFYMADQTACDAFVYRTAEEVCWEKHTAEEKQTIADANRIPALCTLFSGKVTGTEWKKEISCEGEFGLSIPILNGIFGIRRPEMEKKETYIGVSGETMLRMTLDREEGE